jgi:hypothetical protein
MAFDTVVSIGGQSLVDGIWRLLGPALAGLTNPLPIALPGFANAQVRVTQLIPVFPTEPRDTGALILNAGVLITGEALLVVTATAAEGIDVAPGKIELSDLAGSIAIPDRVGTLTDIQIPGTGALAGALGPGTGRVRIPAFVATLAGGTGTAALASPGSLAIPPIPFPAIIPVAANLTPDGPLATVASVEISISGPDGTTGRGLQFRIGKVTVVPDALPGALPFTVKEALQDAVDLVCKPLDLPETLRPEVDEDSVGDLLGKVPDLVKGALEGALTGLLGQTGRLTYPRARRGASCGVAKLPTSATASLSASETGDYLLQIGFERAASTDIAAFPDFAPTGAVDCRVQIGNEFLLDLLCCLVERLPAFTLPNGPESGTSDVNGDPHLACRNFTSATVSLGGAAIGRREDDGISVCIDEGPRNIKSFSLIGALSHRVPLSKLWLLDYVADIAVGFTIGIAFDLDDAASLADLRAVSEPVVSAKVSPNPALLVALGTAGTAVVVMINPLLVPGTGAVAVGVGGLVAAMAYIGAACVAFALRSMARTILSGASLLRSPAALPPGLFEAFGGFSPARVTIDDLTADGVLHTPTAPWALLPKPSAGAPADAPADPGKPIGPAEPILPDIPVIGLPGFGIPALGIGPGGITPTPPPIRPTRPGKGRKAPE